MDLVVQSMLECIIDCQLVSLFEIIISYFQDQIIDVEDVQVLLHVLLGKEIVELQAFA